VLGIAFNCGNLLKEGFVLTSSSKRLYIFATIIELFGICLCSAGLTYEFVAHADFGYILMSTGSIFIAGGSLLFAKVAPWLRGSEKH